MKHADSPEKLHQLFVQALNARDLDALTSLYSDDACLSPAAGDTACGLSQVRTLLASYCAMKPVIQLTTRNIIAAGDTALLMSDWRMTAIAPDGSAVESAGTSVEVARRQADGSWRYLIDLPYGIGD